MKNFYKQALRNLFSAKLRSFLAVLGILVGTASVVTLVSSGELATENALAQFKNLGTDLLAVSFYNTNANIDSKTNTLTLETLAAMKSVSEEIKRVAPYNSLYLDISYEGHKLATNVIGATDELQQVIKIPLASGDFISYLNQYQRYCVIGNDVAEKIRHYSNQKIIGQQLWLGEQIYTIIGVAKPWPESSFFNANINNSVIVPVQSTQLLRPNADVNSVVLQLSTNANIDKLQNSIEDHFKKVASDKKVFFRSAKEFIASMKSQHHTLTLLLGLIGSISLLVGGIGVMNVMLVSVTERKREIGIRKAIGAKQRDIHWLFLTESTALALFGGSLGVLLGIALSYVIAYFAHWGFSLFLLPALIGFIVSSATGVFFGYYPAYRAAQLDPIEALRAPQ